MSLQVWLPLDGNLENYGLLEDLSINSTNVSFLDNGKIGKCFTGRTGYFNIPYFTGKKQLSVAYWVKVNTATATNWLDAFRWYSTDGSTTSMSRNEFYTNCTKTGFWFAGSPNSISGKDTTVGEWYHHAFAIDYSAGIAEFYINGVSVGAVTGVYTTHYLTGENFMIGENGLDLSINDFRIYDHCLSQKEVKELSKGLIGHWPLNDMVGGENLILNGNAIEFNGTYVSGAVHHWGNWSNGSDRSIEHVYGKDWFHFKTPATTTYGGFHQDHTLNGDVIRIKPNTKYTVSATWFASEDVQCVYWFHWRSSEGGSNLSQSNRTFTVTTTPQRVSLTFTSGTNATYTVNRFNLMMGVYHHSAEGVDVYFTDVKMEEGEIATPWIPNPSDDLYSAMGLDDGIIYDTSGYGRNGSVSGTITADSDTPRYSVRPLYSSTTASFQGGSIDLHNQLGHGSTYTLACWAKPTGLNDHGWVIRLGGNNCGLWWAKSEARWVWNENNNGKRCANPTISGDYDNWHHFVNVVDKTTPSATVVKHYVDGELADGYNSHTFDTSSLTQPTSGLYMYFYNAHLSDVRLYATALSADDVKELYETAGSVDKNGNFWGYELSET